MKSKSKVPVFLLMAIMVLLCSTVATEASTINSGAVTASGKTSTGWQTISGKKYYRNAQGKKLKNTWKKIGKYQYYFSKTGAAATSGSVKIGGQYYLFDQKARLVTSKNKVVTIGKSRYYVTSEGKAGKRGWKIVGSKLYYIEKNGKCAANKTVDGIKLTKNAYAQNTAQSRCKQYTMKFIASHTSANMSSSEKLRTCANYIYSYAGFYPKSGRPSAADYTSGDWQYRFAEKLLNPANPFRGNCYNYGCAVASIAKELGYQPDVITLKDDHCFVVIDGRYYDNMGPLLGSATSQWAGYKPLCKVKF